MTTTTPTPRTEPDNLDYESEWYHKGWDAGYAAALEGVAERLEAWAGCVQRLMAVAPTRAVIDETGIQVAGHSIPEERAAIRQQARVTVERWLARDLALLSSMEDGT